MLKYSQSANQADKVVREVEQVIATGTTAYQHYLFFKSKINGTCIALDNDIQSCASDEAIYHEALVHPALLAHPEPKTVLIMGGGEGASAREVLRHATVEKVVMVDIDQEFVQLCQQFIPQWSENVYQDPRMEMHYADINTYLANCKQQFDVVIGDLVDIPDENSAAAMLYAEQFYRKLKPCLSAQAILATQGGALVPAHMQGHLYIRQMLSQVFKNVASYGMVVPSFYHLWGYVIASDSKRLACESMALFDLIRQSAQQRQVDLPATGAAALGAAFLLPQMIQQEFAE